MRYGLLGGWTFPSGGTADYYGSGWNAGAFLEQSYGNKPIGLRVYVTYNRLPSKDEESRLVEAGGIDGNVVLHSPTGAVRPYLTGGAGLSWVKTSDSELQFAFNVGAGVRLDTQSFGSFVEVRYLRIGLEGIALVPLAIGFVFGGR